MKRYKTIKYTPLAYLREFHADRNSHPHRAIITGYGGGKTYAVCMENLIVSGINKGVPNVIIEPTFQMVKDILEPTMFSILEANGLKQDRHFYYNKTTKNFVFPLWGGVLWFRSGDRPEKLKGANLGMVSIDEPFIQDVETYKVAISRSRHPSAKVTGVVLSGTPEKLNWGYDLIQDGRENYKVYQGSTYDNIHLNSSYAERLKSSYGEKEVRAYVYGEFVDMTEGIVYYAFSDENIIPDYTPVATRPLEISCDFNIDIMCWNIGQEVGGVEYTFDYVEMTGTAKTEMMCQLLKAKLYADYANNYSALVFYADIAGSANRPEAAYSNLEIIRNHFPGARIETRHIQNIGDRVSATNRMFQDSTGKRRAYVAQKCKRLINDYKRVHWDHLLRKGTAGELTHASDGESYKFYAKYPLLGAPEIIRKSIHTGV
ncbi:MAG: terminase family protein [Bacteroidia bacterium]|nr:hypothetical protein [Chitinophagaceae bacterium]MCZ2356647.1 terminase family protein [Bacteroidia bacterium]